MVKTMKIVTYNMRHNKMSTRNWSLILDKYDPDIVLAQESLAPEAYRRPLLDEATWQGQAAWSPVNSTCPELHQAFGQQAKQATSQLARGKTVTVKPTGTDKHNRMLANVILPDGRNLTQELVRRGYAWWFQKYSRDQTLAKLETEARQKKVGLWADPNPTPPGIGAKPPKKSRRLLANLCLTA